MSSSCAATKLALFDLDGTLIDSEIGIVATIRHAFARIGAEVPPDEVLRTWIGPSFRETFPAALGGDAARVEAAIAHYRERYIEAGWAEHRVYAGVAELVENLAAAGVALAVVTTKPQPQSGKIVAHLPFGARFTRIYAPDAKAAHSEKAGMVAQALADFAIPADAAVMIGDRRFDIEGARANGVRAIGVSWGFGSRGELLAAGADAIVDSPLQLSALLADDAAQIASCRG